MGELTVVEHLFDLEEYQFPVLTIDGKPWLIAADVGEYLGYAPKALAIVVRRDWAEPRLDRTGEEVPPEMVEGVDFRTLEGQALEDYREIAVNLKLSTNPVSQMTRPVMLLSESGVNLACLLSRKPKGRILRRWLADEVLPAIRQTSAYSADDGLSIALKAALANRQAILRNQQAIAALSSQQELTDFRQEETSRRVADLERRDGYRAEGPQLRTQRLVVALVDSVAHTIDRVGSLALRKLTRSVMVHTFSRKPS